MRRPSWSRAIVAALLLLAAVGPFNVVGRAFSSGPPPGFTGAPGEATCVACHSDFPLNSGTATFSVGVPVNVTPGGVMSVVNVGFQGSATPKHGFEITARAGSNAAVGTWTVLQPGLTKNATGSVFHHEHTSAGSNQLAWMMGWTPPAALPNGPVTFYAAGNEGNGNSSPSGDRIYSKFAKAFQAVLSTDSSAWPIGSNQVVKLLAAGHAGELGFIVPSDDPTPYSFGGPFELQVNPWTGFLAFALQSPQYFQNLTATLDAAGRQAATVTVPAFPPLIGLPLHFAAITTDAQLNPTEVSNRLTVTFQ